MRVLSNTSGQALVIAVLLGFLLVLSVPIIIYLNQINSSHQAFVEKKAKGLVTAKEAVAYAKEILSSTPSLWQAALNNQFATTPGLEDCSGALLNGLDGSQFKITCDKNTGQSYQVHVTGTGMAFYNGALHPIRKLEAYVSQQTVAMNLPDDQHSAIALQLGSVPVVSPPPPPQLYNGDVVVQWGPLDCLDPSASMDITNSPMDSGLFPRMFLNNGLTSSSPLRSAITPQSPTDAKEVWAFQKLGSPPPLDSDGYKYEADLAVSIPSLASSCVGTCVAPYPSNGAGTGHFIVGAGNVLKLDASFASHLSAGTVLYIEGDAELDGFAWDAKPLGALIVTNNLYLNTPGTSLATLRIPPAANLEYFPNGAAMPCLSNWTSNTFSCAPPTPSQFRGFLWVKNSLIVQQPGWGLAGTVVIGDPSSSGVSGQLDITPSGSTEVPLTIYYDDEVNRGIKVTAVQLQSDSLREITP